ncbi:serine protein kinase [Aspergillus floccosus]
MRRFERIYDVVEPVEEYRRGGYHPVHLDDVFQQRYTVIGKLAYGQYTTVWLAVDAGSNQRQVALKILKAEVSKNNHELSMLLRVSASRWDHPGKTNIVALLDHFYHTGPNGTHLCLVFPVMVSDGQAMTATGVPHCAGYVRTVSQQILLGLDFLHQSGIVHCDLLPANIMVSMAGDTREDFLQPPEFSPVKIGDLGGAQWAQQCDQQPVTPISLRAPELIHREKWDVSIDIWSLGCLIFQLATNEPLFPLDVFGLTREKIDKEHDSLISQRFCVDGQRDQKFAAYLKERLPDDFGAENARSLASSLLLMLQVSPER